MDSTVWAAVLAGGTAVLASWVTSYGNARAAKVQAEASADAHHRSRLRESRRTAYLTLIEHAHVTGEFHYRLDDIYMQVADPSDQSVRLERLRGDLRDAFDPLMRSARVILMEGPVAVAELAEAVTAAAAEANGALFDLAQGRPGAREHFDELRRGYRLAVDGFIEGAQRAMAATR